MTTTPDADERPAGSANGTLGDVLYADQTKERPTEADWLALVHCIAGGDQLALHALYQRSHRIVFTLAMRILNDRETAEEVTLDVFYDIWRRAPGYDAAAGTVVGWIMNLARSRSIDRLRFERRKKRVNPYAAEPLVPATESSSEGLAGLAEQRRVLRTGLGALTAAEREAIEAAFFSELTYAEVARELGRPLGTVKTRIRSGLANLRRALKLSSEDI